MDKRRWVFAMKKMLLLCCAFLSVFFALVACSKQTGFEENQDAAINAWQDQMAKDTARQNPNDILAAYAALPQPDSGAQLAQIFALAVARGNGYAQYALLDDTLKQTCRTRFEACGWATGMQTPWIESFDIAQIKRKPTYTLVFFLKTASGTLGQFQINLSVENADGAYRIASIESLEGRAEPYVIVE